MNTIRTLAASAAIIIAPGTLAQSYVVTNLGSLDAESAALALEANGEVAGYTSNADHQFRATVWHNGAPIVIDPLAGDQHSIATVLDGAGAAGGASFSLGEVSATGFLWSNGVVESLSDFVPRGAAGPGFLVGAVGALEGPYLVRRPAVRVGSATLVLGALGVGEGQAFDANASAWVVGESIDGQRRVRATLWLNGAPTDLGTLGGPRSWAHAINDAGLVVGASDTSSGDLHAALFVLDGAGAVTQRIDLGVLAGRDSVAYDINALDQVVGVSNARAALWRAGEVVALDERIAPTGRWRLEAARAINIAGEIVGFGYELGTPSAFLLTPCAGDANVDFVIDFGDLNILLSVFNTPVAPGSGADFNNDGFVGFDDLNLLLSGFNSPCE